MNKDNVEKFIEKVKTKYPTYFDEYTILNLSEYDGDHKKLKIKHNCGNIFEMNPMHIKRGQGCHLCKGGQKNNEWFVNQVNLKVGDEYTPLEEYITGKTKIKFKHNTCGNIFPMRPEDFLNGQRCPDCAKEIRASKHRRSIESIKEDILKYLGPEYELVDKDIKSVDNLKLRHTVCGNIWNTNISNIKRECRCFECYGSKKRTDEEVAAEIKKLDPGYELVNGTYVNATTKFKLKHVGTPENPGCNKNFETLMINFRNGHRCPNCAFKSSSSYEKEILKLVRNYYPNADKKRFYPNEKNHKEFIEADICIEELKLIIEFDGIYWHSTKRISDKDYHLNKTKFFYKNGYRTIHIFEDEWVNKNSIVVSKLKHILKQDDSEKVFARKCKIKEIDSKTSNNFLNLYHIQGVAPSNKKLGLYYDEELVAVMTFGKPRAALGQNSSDDYVELVRYATSKNVIGGFSKLLRSAIKMYDFKKIITYADLRWSPISDNVYDKNGFVLDHISDPNYFYYDQLEKHHRYQFRKNVLKEKFPDIYDDSLTEFQIMDQTKYLRVYDCGNLVYKMEIKK